MGMFHLELACGRQHVPIISNGSAAAELTYIKALPWGGPDGLQRNSAWHYKLSV